MPSGSELTKSSAAPRGMSAASRWVTAVVISVIAVRLAILLSQGREHWIAFVPDDAFYYLGFGRGFVTTGHWTFDGGVSPSSGFHLAQAYVAAASWGALHGLGPNAPVYGLMITSAVCDALAAVVCARLAGRLFGAASSAATALVFLSKNALICGTSGMEWSMAVLALALASETALIVRIPSKRQVMKACAIGLLAVLARSDSAVWIGILAAASILAHRSANASRVAALLLGSALGVLVVGCHTYLITGDFVQDSVLAKLHWGKLQGLDLPGALNTLAMATGLSWLGKGLDRVVLLALLAFGLAAGTFARAEKRAALLAASGTLLVAIMLATKNSGGLQYWYTGSVIVPCCLLWSALLARVQRVSRAGGLLSAGCVSIACIASISSARSGPWQNQVALLRAGLELANESWSACRIGSWNAGIIGHYRGHDVINLDGLANHDALLASKDGELSKYVVSANVQYIVDFAAMLRSREYRVRGGYDGPERALRVTEVQRAPDTDPQWLSSSVVYWRVQSAARTNLSDVDCRKTP